MLGMDVDFVEELGATQLFHGRLAGAEFVVQSPTGQIPADVRRLALSIDPAHVHLFDPQTGKRLGR
jgi:sn-glycerol 3-phosphate transport system ATP-binding protein